MKYVIIVIIIFICDVNVLGQDSVNLTESLAARIKQKPNSIVIDSIFFVLGTLNCDQNGQIEYGYPAYQKHLFRYLKDNVIKSSNVNIKCDTLTAKDKSKVIKELSLNLDVLDNSVEQKKRILDYITGKDELPEHDILDKKVEFVMLKQLPDFLVKANALPSKFVMDKHSALSFLTGFCVRYGDWLNEDVFYIVTTSKSKIQQCQAALLAVGCSKFFYNQSGSTSFKLFFKTTNVLKLYLKEMETLKNSHKSDVKLFVETILEQDISNKVLHPSIEDYKNILKILN